MMGKRRARRAAASASPDRPATGAVRPGPAVPPGPAAPPGEAAWATGPPAEAPAMAGVLGAAAYPGEDGAAGAAGTAGPGLPGMPGVAQPAGQQPPVLRPAAKAGHDPWRAAFFGVLILAILAGAAWALLGSSLLVVRHEEVTGNRLVPASEVLAAAGIRRGTPLASVNTLAAAHRVEQIDQVLSATVSRSWPDTIVISVRERTPVLAVAAGGRFELIDPAGVTVRWSPRKPAGMPLLAAPPVQLRGSHGVLAAASVLRQLPARLRLLVESVTAPSAQDVTLHLRGGVTVAWGGAAQTRAKAAEVIVLLRTRARYLDVSDPNTAVTAG
jgi:cell division protein FtsQ